MNEKFRILMLEDNPADAELVERELKKANIPFLAKRVETKGDFAKALKEFHPDIILADYSLPRFNGIAALFLLKEQGLATIPFIFVTGSMDEETAVECMKAGAADYVLKDRLVRLGTAVKNALEKQSLSREKKQAEEKFCRSEHRLQSLIENCSDVIMILNSHGVIQFESPSVQKLLGYKAEELIGRGIFDYLHSDDVEVVKKTMRDAIQNPRVPFLIEFRCLQKNGSFRILEATGKGYFENSHLVGVVLNARDITERKRLERLKDEFVSTTSHEMRTPLATAKIAVSNLREGIAGSMTQNQSKIVETAARNIERLGKIIDNILDLSRLESGAAKLNRESVNIPTLLQEAMSNFDWLAKERGIQLEQECLLKNVKDFSVDPDLIMELLGNLLDNALRYAKKRVLIKASTTNGFLKLSVGDDGPGIACEDTKDLFSKFRQINRPKGGSGYKGTGLGLAICKHIVNLHGGKIWVESQVGQGATFHFTLPWIAAEGEEKAAKEKGLALLTQPKKILIIDDEGELTEMLDLTLRTSGFQVEIALDGQSGIAKATSFKPDLILLDVRMPGMDGWEVSRKLQSLSETKKVPIAIMTAFRSDDLDEKARIVGAKYVLLKPLDEVDLISFLKKAA